MSPTMRGNIPPLDMTSTEAAEASFVFSMILDERLHAEGFGLVKEEHFSSRKMRNTFVALSKLYEAGEVWNTMLLVWRRIEAMGRAREWAGGYHEWLGHFDKLPQLTSIDRCARIIRDGWRMREAFAATLRAQGRIALAHDAQEVLDELADASFALAGDSPTFTGIESKELAKLVGADLIAHAKLLASGARIGVPSGFDALDDVLSPLANGSLTILGARPGMGKTSFLVSMALRIARAGVPVYFVTTEMTDRDILQRAISSLSGVPFGNLSRMPGAVIEAFATVGKLPITWDQAIYPTIPELRAKVERVAAKRLRERKPLGIVMVDYLGKIRSTLPDRASSEEKAAQVVMAAKSAAQKTSLPWLVPAQLNREVTKGVKMRKPQMSDLRGSGAIEAEADNIVFLHREDYANHQAGIHAPPNHQAELIVSKQRNGATGSATLRFDAECTRFDDIGDGGES